MNEMQLIVCKKTMDSALLNSKIENNKIKLETLIIVNIKHFSLQSYL